MITARLSVRSAGSSAPSAPTAATTFSTCPIRSSRASAISRTSARHVARAIEAEVDFKADKFSVYASYAYIDATFLNALTLGSNSPYADANGNIYVETRRPDPDDPA